MSNNNQFSISRRKVLAGLGTIGIASAGAGLGTTAFFSDTESLEGWLQAGRVDLKLDYRTTYKPWLSADEVNARKDEFLAMNAPDVIPIEGDMSLHVDSVPMAGSAGFELNSDGEAPSHNAWGLSTLDIDTCGDDRLIDGAEEAMFVDLRDIKPYDEGETTFSLHLCGNPAYLSMKAEGIMRPENDVIEPEVEAGERADPTRPFDFRTEGDIAGELDQYLYTTFWYDPNCNNLKDRQEGPACVEIILDKSGSMNNDPGNTGRTKWERAIDGALELVDALAGGDTEPSLAPNAVSIETFQGSNAVTDISLTQDADAVRTVLADLRDDTPSGATPIGEGLQQAIDDFNADAASNNPVCPADGEKFFVLLTNGGENSGPSVTTNAATARGIGTLITIGVDSQADQLLEDIASDDPDTGDPLFFDVDAMGIGDAFEIIARSILKGEVCLFKGPLFEFLELVKGDHVALPMENLEECDWPRAGRDCADGNSTHCYALKWELGCKPEDFREQMICADLVDNNNNNGTSMVTMADYLTSKGLPLNANVTQTDAVHFGLTFKAEQCRHNLPVGTGTGSGFVDVTPEVNQNGGFGQDGESFVDKTGQARGRYGDNNPNAGAYEVGVGQNSPSENNANYSFVSGATVPWMYEYDGAGNATFTVDSVTVSGPVGTPNGRIGVQAKADESTVEVENVMLSIDGMPANLSSNSVTATNDGAGRDIRYLVINTTAAQAQMPFVLKGDVTVTRQGDYPGSNEGHALDIVVE